MERKGSKRKEEGKAKAEGKKLLEYITLSELKCNFINLVVAAGLRMCVSV